MAVTDWLVIEYAEMQPYLNAYIWIMYKLVTVQFGIDYWLLVF